MPERVQKLNFIIITVITIYTVTLQSYLVQNPIIDIFFDSVLTFFSSIGFYRLLIFFLYWLISNNEFFLKLYWGKRFIHGLWSYTYTLEGVNDSTVYFGVWKFEQDLYKTKVIGFGLTDEFKVRSRVTSVTSLIEVDGKYDIINTRSDNVDPETNYYSKTSMMLESRKGFVNKYPIKIRAQTIIYGGKLTGKVHNDIFIKHENALSEDDVIFQLKMKLNQ